MNKQEQKQLIIDIMNEDSKDGLYKRKTAVQDLIDELKRFKKFPMVDQPTIDAAIEFAELRLEMEEQQIVDAFGVGCQVESTRLIGYQEMANEYYQREYGGNK